MSATRVFGVTVLTSTACKTCSRHPPQAEHQVGIPSKPRIMLHRARPLEQETLHISRGPAVTHEPLLGLKIYVYIYIYMNLWYMNLLLVSSPDPLSLAVGAQGLTKFHSRLWPNWIPTVGPLVQFWAFEGARRFAHPTSGLVWLAWDSGEGRSRQRRFAHPTLVLVWFLLTLVTDHVPQHSSQTSLGILLSRGQPCPNVPKTHQGKLKQHTR